MTGELQATLTVPDELVDALVERILPRLQERSAGASSPWLDVDGAAEYLAMPRDSLYKLTSRGAIPHRKVGNRLHFHRDELDGWMDEHRRGTPPRPHARRLRAA